MELPRYSLATDIWRVQDIYSTPNASPDHNQRGLHRMFAPKEPWNLGTLKGAYHIPTLQLSKSSEMSEMSEMSKCPSG